MGLVAVGVAEGEGERRLGVSAADGCRPVLVDVDPREVTEDDDWTANREEGGLSELSMDARDVDSVGAAA